MNATTKQDPKPGDVGCIEGGQVVELIARHDGEYVVRPIFDHAGDGEPCEPYYGSPMAVRGFWTGEPPAPRFAESVIELEAKINELADQRDALRAEIREAEGALKTRMANITRHQQLQTLEDFIEGRITHVVVFGYGEPEIKEFAEALKPSQDDQDHSWNARSPGLKLLTLFGKSGGDLAWGLNEYRCGSGSNCAVVPCTSSEQARERLSQHLEECWRDFVPERPWHAEVAMKAARKYALNVPEHVEAAVRAYRMKGIEDAISKQEQQLAANRSALEQARAA